MSCAGRCRPPPFFGLGDVRNAQFKDGYDKYPKWARYQYRTHSSNARRVYPSAEFPRYSGSQLKQPCKHFWLSFETIASDDYDWAYVISELQAAYKLPAIETRTLPPKQRYVKVWSILRA
eukprot:jgi/Botrbrau1/2113/Bobra.0093s0020.1